MYYKQNHKNIMKAIEIGSTGSKQTSLDPKKIKGLGRPSDTRANKSSSDEESITQKLLDRMKKVQESNKRMLERSEDRSLT